MSKAVPPEGLILNDGRSVVLTGYTLRDSVHAVTALAEGLGLRFTHGFDAGLSRTGSPGSFAYIGPDGGVIDDPATLERIHALAIPPAWVSVWIAPEADAHLQATGIDRRGRKQYRYHASWRQERDALKYRDMEDFARIQPALRSRISRDLNGRQGAFASAGPRSRSATARHRAVSNRLRPLRERQRALWLDDPTPRPSDDPRWRCDLRLRR